MRAALVVTLLLTVSTALAEIAPEVYREMQRNAPELVQIEVDEVDIDREFSKPDGCGFFDFEIERHVTAKVKVAQVVRSRSGLRAGAVIEIRYMSLNPCEGWSGPGPIPILEKGTRTYAWLVKKERGFAPAAGGASFAAGLPQ